MSQYIYAANTCYFIKLLHVKTTPKRPIQSATEFSQNVVKSAVFQFYAHGNYSMLIKTKKLISKKCI